MTPSFQGTVYLVGAGPGDPELLTLKALNILQQADVIVYDQCVSTAILDYAPPKCELIFAGKRKNYHKWPQTKINRLLAQLALTMSTVVRLKGGDPLLFARAGEEISYLRDKGIPIRIIPGVTAASAAAASSSFPLTDRHKGQAVTFISGYSHLGVAEHNWTHLAESGHTLVVYMGLSTAPSLAQNLIDHGLDPKTSIALISHASLSSEKTIFARLEDLVHGTLAQSLEGPALLIIGAVTSMAALPRSILENVT